VVASAITLNLGKNGLTANFVTEVKTILNKHKKVRIKLLKSYLSQYNVKEDAKKLPGKQSIRGNVLTITKHGTT